MDRPGTENGDDVVRAAQRFAKIGGRLRMEFDSDFLGDQPGDGDGVGEPFGVDVHQRHLMRPQFRVHQNVFEKILGEDHPARSDQCDF